MTKFIKAITVAAAAALTAPVAASADTITFDKTYSSLFGDPSLKSIVQISGDTTPTQNVYAGGFNVTSNGGLDLVAFCIELSEHLNLNNAYSAAASPFTAAVSENLSKLFTGFYEDIDTDLEAAAFQVSIWELISDTTADLTSGNFQLAANGVYDNNAVGVEAATYLTGLSSFDADYDLSFYIGTDTQDLVSGQPTPVPLPATGLMLLAGLGALGLHARKRR